MSAPMVACEVAELAEMLAAVGHDVQRQGDLLIARWIGDAVPALVVDTAAGTWWLDDGPRRPRPVARMVRTLRGNRGWAWPCSGATAALRHAIALLAEARGVAVIDLVERALREHVARETCGDDADAAERSDLVLWGGSIPPPR